MAHHQFEPLPPFADPRAAVRDALPSLRPAKRIGVTEAAEQYMRVSVAGQWQKFRRDTAPYMVEPTDMIASRKYRAMTFVGPSQSGKTMMLQEALAYIITCDPGRVALFQMTRDAAREFERNKLSPTIRNSPDLRALKGRGRGADNQYEKQFQGGTHLTINWPSIAQLSSATIRTVMMTDYDHFPASIEGEGDAYTLARARTRTLWSRGMVVCESSPGAPLVDETWRAGSLHAVPPVAYGVLSLYPEGTRARWYWPCPHCDAEFEPRFDRLKYPADADPRAAGEAAEMACPACGGLIGHGMKRELNAAGRWLHESADGQAAVPLDHADIRRTDMLSYWLNGAAAAFATWAELVEQYRNAVAAFEATGDEEKLKSAMNTGQAMPYLPRAASADAEVTLQGLKDKAQGVESAKGVAPAWTRYIFVCIDTQATHFVVSVVAYGAEGMHQVIDRFDIAAPAGDDTRTLKPFDRAEDWDELTPLARRVWPIEGTSTGLMPAALAVDMQGGGSATPNAYKFYRARRKAGEGHMWFLTRGSGGLKHSDRVWLRAPERVSGSALSKAKRRNVAQDITILNMATDRLKDAVASSLRMIEPGANMCLVAAWQEEPHLTELTAERRTEKGWEKRRGMQRNEAFDHLVQARALHIIKGGEKIDWSAPPAWAGGVSGVFAVALSAPDAPAPDGDGVITAEHTPRRRRRAGRMRM